jgi:hypothetical protein
MCFSAEASFIGGSALTAIGVLSVRKNREPDQRLFAAMPLVFGIQQIAEGFVWTALKSEQKDLMLKLSAYVFLAAALLIWPTFVPLSARLMETDQRRKPFLSILTALGAATSLSYLAGFFIYEVTVRIDYMHIDYGVNAPQQYLKIAYLAYMVVTLLPFLITSSRRVWMLGAVVVISYAVAAYFYSEYLLSVWCFFAALASAIVWWIVGEDRAAARQTVQISQ